LESLPSEDNEDIENCPEERPWYNGAGCVKCLYPFDVFDADARQCMACDSDKIYNSSTHQCDSRRVIYVNSDMSRVMATDNVSVEDYQKRQQELID